MIPLALESISIVNSDVIVHGRTLFAFDTGVTRISIWLSWDEQEVLVSLLRSNLEQHAQAALAQSLATDPNADISTCSPPTTSSVPGR